MDATSKASICDRLISEIDDMPPRLQRAAKYIVDYPNDFGLDPIRLTARKIGISANSLVRLANYLGYENYDALREPFRSALVERHDDTVNEQLAARKMPTSGFARDQLLAARNELDIVGRSLQLLSDATAEEAVSALLRARNAYVTATRASYALAYFFHYVGRMALPNLHLVPRHMGSAVDELIAVDSADVLFAITFAPYSADTIKALRLARTRGAKIILMSDSELIAPNTRTDLFLKVSSHSTHYFGCYVGAMAVLECLLAHLVREGGSDARARIASYQAVREDFGAYWQQGVVKR